MIVVAIDEEKEQKAQHFEMGVSYIPHPNVIDERGIVTHETVFYRERSMIVTLRRDIC